MQTVDVSKIGRIIGGLQNARDQVWRFRAETREDDTAPDHLDCLALALARSGAAVQEKKRLENGMSDTADKTRDIMCECAILLIYALGKDWNVNDYPVAVDVMEGDPEDLELIAIYCAFALYHARLATALDAIHRHEETATPEQQEESARTVSQHTMQWLETANEALVSIAFIPSMRISQRMSYVLERMRAKMAA